MGRGFGVFGWYGVKVFVFFYVKIWFCLLNFYINGRLLVLILFSYSLFISEGLDVYFDD